MKIFNIKTLAVVSCAIVLLVALVACSQQTNKMYHYDRQVAPYLHEMTFDDYRQDDAGETGKLDEVFGCSAVRNGNFIGRNYDYHFNDTPEFLVHVKAKEGRFASVGMCQHLGLREDSVKANKYDKSFELIPNFTLDGINENGVYISDNVVSAKDAAEITGTNPQGKSLIITQVPRYILDNAKSADHAIELMKSLNIYGHLTSESEDNASYLHYMICDKSKTYFVEIVDNKLVINEVTGDRQIMTNFYLALPELTEHSAGVERYKILHDNYAESKTFDGMVNLLRRVQYSKAYDKTISPRRYTDIGIYQSYFKEANKDLIEDYYDEVCDLCSGIIKKNAREDKDEYSGEVWITTHNSTYDMEKKTLRVYVQEDYDHPYEFGM